MYRLSVGKSQSISGRRKDSGRRTERLQASLNSGRDRNEEKILLSLAGCGTRDLVSFYDGWTFGRLSRIFYDRLHWDCDYDGNSPFFG